MTKLMNYLQALLGRFYSKTASDNNAICELFGSTDKGVTYDVSSVPTSVVAPSAGYVFLKATPTSERRVQMYTQINNMNPAVRGHANDESVILMPVRKGQTVGVMAGGGTQYLVFYKYFGGGLIALFTGLLKRLEVAYV